MIVIHIKEVREKPLFRWILSLYDSKNKRFQGEEGILIYNEDKNFFAKRLERVLESFQKRGYTSISSEVRRQIFEANGLALPQGWMSFQV